MRVVKRRVLLRSWRLWDDLQSRSALRGRLCNTEWGGGGGESLNGKVEQGARLSHGLTGCGVHVVQYVA
jgi:hypothetical protein